jgi:hypothetical protein
MITKETLFM